MASESEFRFSDQFHALRSCANRMIAILLFLPERPGCREIRPHSLKAGTISALTGEITKGKANLSQIASQ